MTQNRSHAVMAQRHEPHGSLDFFPTPPWATRALIEHVLVGSGWRMDNLVRMTCREPACGNGDMARPLGEYFRKVAFSDIHPYGYGAVQDFLFMTPPAPVDWTITNPPFKLADQFIARALDTSRIGVAMLVRATFMEGITRYAKLFARRPPIIYAPFTERVIMYKGRLYDPDREYDFVNPKTKEVERKKPSSATAYCWLVWATSTHHIAGRTEVRWIPPCRRELTRSHDYAEAA
jgi:hypothetical protein